MESRLRSILLTVCSSALLLLSGCATVPQGNVSDDGSPPQVIEPQVERRDIDVAAIDTEDFELTAFTGLMSVEDFESGSVVGARLAYHVSEWLFAEATYGSTDLGVSSFERLAPPATLLSDRTLTYYDVSLGYNLFPGEVFFGRDRAWNSSVYAIGGLGSTEFNGDNQFTINFGFGIKVLPWDFVAVRIEARDYLFDTEITGEKKTTHNIQTTLNLSWFF